MLFYLFSAIFLVKVSKNLIQSLNIETKLIAKIIVSRHRFDPLLSLEEFSILVARENRP
jgi:hypothetical protein